MELEVKLYEQREAITEAKPWAGVECSHGAGIGGHSFPPRGGSGSPFHNSPLRASSRTLGKALIISQYSLHVYYRKVAPAKSEGENIKTIIKVRDCEKYCIMGFF